MGPCMGTVQVLSIALPWIGVPWLGPLDGWFMDCWDCEPVSSRIGVAWARGRQGPKGPWLVCPPGCSALRGSMQLVSQQPYWSEGTSMVEDDIAWCNVWVLSNEHLCSRPIACLLWEPMAWIHDSKGTCRCYTCMGFTWGNQPPWPQGEPFPRQHDQSWVTRLGLLGSLIGVQYEPYWTLLGPWAQIVGPG